MIYDLATKHRLDPVTDDDLEEVDTARAPTLKGKKKKPVVTPVVIRRPCIPPRTRISLSSDNTLWILAALRRPHFSSAEGRNHAD